MNCTRRSLLKSGAGFLACGTAAARTRWSEDRLGIFCHLGSDEASARKTLAAAREAGFRTAQISFPWTKVGDAYLKALPRWLEAEGVKAGVLSAYVNCCRPETVIMDCRREDFEKAIETAGSLGCRHLVAWTGGHAPDLMKPDARNFTPQAEEAIVRFVDAHAKRLRKAHLVLALETYITLACPDAASLRKVLNRLPENVGAVLDPPNLTPVENFEQRDRVLREIVTTLGSRVAVIHLKDFSLAPDGRGYLLPGPLHGAMNYPLYAELILSLPASIPVIAEHLKPDEFAEARRRLLPVFARQ